MNKIITYEERYYFHQDSVFRLNRKQRALIDHPYSSATIQNLNNFDFTISSNLSELLNLAVEELSKLDGFIKEKVSGFPMILLRTEALSSTQIEHFNSSNKNIAIAQISNSSNSESNVIKDNLEAMNDVLNSNKEISLDLLIEINKKVLNDDSVKIRDKVNWIGSSNSLPQNAIYVPPHPELLQQYMDEFIKFTKRTDLHPLVHAALAHAYFEHIHPFEDGNGRVGRIIIQIILKNSYFLENMFMPISAGLVKNNNEYINALNNFKDGNYETIIELILNSALSVVPIVYDVLDQLIILKASWQDKLKARKDSYIWKILDELIIQPVINVNYIKNKYNINDQAVRNSIKTLIEANIIAPINANKRNVLYESSEVLKILDDFKVL